MYQFDWQSIIVGSSNFSSQAEPNLTPPKPTNNAGNLLGQCSEVSGIALSAERLFGLAVERPADLHLCMRNPAHAVLFTLHEPAKASWLARKMMIS